MFEGTASLAACPKETTFTSITPYRVDNEDDVVS